MFRQKSYFFKKGNYYYLYYKDLNSKWKNISTGCSKKKDAEKWSHEFLSNKLNPVKRSLQVAQNSFKTLQANINSYNDINLSKSTNEIYKRVMNNFSRIINKEELNDIQMSDIENYKNVRSNEVTKTTVNIEIRTLKTIFRYAVKNKFILNNPALDVKQFSIPEKEKPTFTSQQLENLLILMNPLFRNITLIAIYTGCRLNEILNLEYRNINLKERTIEIVNKPSFKTKSGKIRRIPISQELFVILTNNIFVDEDRKGYIFCNPWGSTFNKSYVSRKFKSYLRIAGLPESLHLHCLRHTFITELIKNNVDVFKVMKIVGHSSIKTTLGYTHLFVDDIRNEMEKLKFINSSSQRI